MTAVRALAGLLALSALPACGGAEEPAAAPPPAVTVEVKQYRADIAPRRLSVSVGNPGGGPVVVTGLELLPAGFEPVDGWFRTTASDLARDASAFASEESQTGRQEWWRHGGFDNVEKYDDRVVVFGTRLGEGRHEFSYIVRATTSGTFKAAGAQAEAMYSPEVQGRTAAATVTIR